MPVPEIDLPRPPSPARRAPTRTCVGCAESGDPDEMVRLVFGEGQVAFDLAGGTFGRGAHVHPRPGCLAKAPRGLSRSFRQEVRTTPAELGAALVAACDRRMSGLLLAAKRTRAVAAGADEALSALAKGAPLLIVATDAGRVASSHEVQAAVAAGRAVAWRTKDELGGLLGGQAVAVCAVRSEAIAEKLKTLRAAADAGAATTREGAGWSSTCPEAR